MRGYRQRCLHVDQVPSGDTLAAFHFNHGRSCQALGRLVQAAELFTATLAQCGGKHASARSQAAVLAAVPNHVAVPTTVGPFAWKGPRLPARRRAGHS